MAFYTKNSPHPLLRGSDKVLSPQKPVTMIKTDLTILIISILVLQFALRYVVPTIETCSKQVLSAIYGFLDTILDKIFLPLHKNHCPPSPSPHLQCWDLLMVSFPKHNQDPEHALLQVVQSQHCKWGEGVKQQLVECKKNVIISLCMGQNREMGPKFKV